MCCQWATFFNFFMHDIVYMRLSAAVTHLSLQSCQQLKQDVWLYKHTDSNSILLEPFDCNNKKSEQIEAQNNNANDAKNTQTSPVLLRRNCLARRDPDFLWM